MVEGMVDRWKCPSVLSLPKSEPGDEAFKSVTCLQKNY